MAKNAKFVQNRCKPGFFSKKIDKTNWIFSIQWNQGYSIFNQFSQEKMPGLHLSWTNLPIFCEKW